MPGAKEQRYDYRRADDHRRIFTKEEESKLHRRIFGVISANELLLCLRQVKWEPVRFGKHRDGENDERNKNWDPEQDPLAAERNDSQRHHRWRHRTGRRQPIIEFVDVSRCEVLLQQQLHRVRDGLNEPEKGDILTEPEKGHRYSHAVRTEPVLDHCADFALCINGVRNHRQNDHKDQAERFDQRHDDGYQQGGHTVAGASSFSVTSSTPWSPILLSENPSRSGMASAICLKTSSTR